MSGPTKEWDLDVVLEARANKHRRQFVYALRLMPHSIHQLAELCNLSLPIIHKHIEILERAGLVLRKKFSRTNVLTLQQSALQVLQDWLGQFPT